MKKSHSMADPFHSLRGGESLAKVLVKTNLNHIVDKVERDNKWDHLVPPPS